MNHILNSYTPTGLIVFVIFLSLAFIIGCRIDKKRMQKKINGYHKGKKINMPKGISESLDEFEERIS